ncbi:hypothetical protein V2J09_023582 [Rumex salicifolius]
MSKLVGGADEIEAVSTSFRLDNSSSWSNSFSGSSNDEEFIRQWAEIQRLPTYQRSRACLLFNEENADGKGKRVIDVKHLGSLDRRRFVERLIKQIEVDNLQLLQKIKKRMDRLTSLIGPPGCGKTSLLMALSGSLKNSLKVSGDVTYNGYKLNEFVPQKTCAYVSQYDLHIPQITVRESLDFATCCQGVGRRSERRSKLGLFQIITDATALIALLQPAPEIFNLFDDIILMAEGKVVYHGPTSCVLGFFEECGFRLPQRKGVISRKDQWQYWFLDDQPYNHFSVDMFCERFKASLVGRKLYEQVSQPHVKSENDETALSFSVYSLSMWELFQSCMSREYLLVKRNSFIYLLRMTQIVILAFIKMPVFIRTELAVDVVHANYYLGALFYGLTVFLADGLAEAGLMMMGLPVLFKQRDLYLYPAWAHAIPAPLLMVPFSLVTALVWTSLTYYVTGFSPEIGRFFGQFLFLSLVHFTSVSFYRFLIALFQTRVAALTACSTFLSSSFIFAGFVIPQSSMPAWLKWVFWADPLSYGEIGLSGNEFLAPRSQKEMRKHGGFTEKKLQLLSGITGAFRPGVLTALMGAGGAGKTTLLDDLSGRKTSETFTRVFGYSEETDLHSPQITVQESLLYSAWLRLPDNIDSHTKREFVNHVLESTELDEIKDLLVGTPGVSGLSTEQRKRLTIAVELVSNPSIIFLDEPTTGLDARAASIVMRAVKKVASAGRTVVCTIHQPSIHIFEAFDELVLLKVGGQIIYSGPLGHSQKVIDYFERISGEPKIRDNYNPAT